MWLLLVLALFCADLRAICNSTNCATCPAFCDTGCCLRAEATATITDPVTSQPVGKVEVINNPNGTLTVKVTNTYTANETVLITLAFGSCNIQFQQLNLAPSTTVSHTFTCPSCPNPPNSGTVTVSLFYPFDGDQHIATTTPPIAYTFCCVCSRSEGYWQCNPDCWPVDTDATICSLLNSVPSVADCSCQPSTDFLVSEILNQPSNTPWLCLAKRWIAAYFNIVTVYGNFSDGIFDVTNYNSCIESTFIDAGNMLSNTVCTQVIPPNDEATATMLGKILESFNLGLLDPTSCPNYCDPCSAGEVCLNCNVCADLVQSGRCSCDAISCPFLPTCRQCRDDINCDCDIFPGCVEPLTCDNCVNDCGCAAIGCAQDLTQTCAELGCTCESLDCKNQVEPGPLNCSLCQLFCHQHFCRSERDR